MDNERFFNITNILLKKCVIIEKDNIRFVIIKISKLFVEAKEIEKPLLHTFTYSELFLSYQNCSLDTKGYLFVD